jgi:high-affinity nickel-transport protein
MTAMIGAAVVATGALGFGLVASAAGFGFRHGLDWDHLAAIGDITGSQPTPRRSIFLATAYAVGHGIVVLAIGLAAIALSERFPSGLDDVMARVVGATLVALGLYVLVQLPRQGRAFRMRSRWMLVFAFVRRVARRRRGARHVVVIEHEHAHEHDAGHPHEHPAHSGSREPVAVVQTHRHVHHHVVEMPDEPFAQHGFGTALFVGMVHGIGAETPTQVVLFATAAGVSGKGGGVPLLVAFLVGLFAANTAVAFAATFGFATASRGSRASRAYLVVSAITGAGSLVVGVMFLVGAAGVLPALA